MDGKIKVVKLSQCPCEYCAMRQCFASLNWGIMPTLPEGQLMRLLTQTHQGQQVKSSR